MDSHSPQPNNQPPELADPNPPQPDDPLATNPLGPPPKPKAPTPPHSDARLILITVAACALVIVAGVAYLIFGPHKSKEPVQTGPQPVISSVANQSHDNKRQTDINALASHIEAYYAEKGYYPTLKELNSSDWRKAHLAGLDTSVFTDPRGSGTSLVATPEKNKYAYTPVGCVDNQCTGFTLTAFLSNNSPYTKSSL
jgi:hypothetical protein